MALVDYASSSDAEDEADTTAAATRATKSTLKRKYDDALSDLPPLPSKFHDLYASTARVSTRDDPSLHGGRKRVTPHIEGNWPTHLYVEWYPSTAEHASLTTLISSLQAENSPHSNVRTDMQTFLTSDLGAPLPLHISLSRPIGLATDQKDGFLSSLDQAVNFSSIRPFEVAISGLDWVPNFEKTRWFLVLRLHKPANNGLNKLLDISNRVAEEFGQPPLYINSTTNSGPRPEVSSKKPVRDKKAQSYLYKQEQRIIQDVSDAFHISIAWSLNPPSQQLLQFTKLKIGDEGFAEVKGIKVKIEEIKAKLGNIVTNIRLPNKVLEGKGLFGV